MLPVGNGSWFDFLLLSSSNSRLFLCMSAQLIWLQDGIKTNSQSSCCYCLPIHVSIFVHALCPLYYNAVPHFCSKGAQLGAAIYWLLGHFFCPKWCTSTDKFHEGIRPIWCFEVEYVSSEPLGECLRSLLMVWCYLPARKSLETGGGESETQWDIPIQYSQSAWRSPG